MKKTLLALSIALLPMMAMEPAHAATRFDLTDPALAARVGDVEFPRASVVLLYQVAKNRMQDLTEKRAMQAMIENHLLARHALSVLPESELVENNQVGFRPDVMREDQLVVNLQTVMAKPLQDAIKKLKGGKLEGTITRPFTINKKQLLPITQMKGLMAYGLTPEQEAIARKTELLRYRFSAKSKEQALTLWDIYERQNVQGRVALAEGDVNFLKQAAVQRLGSLYVLHWVRTESGMKPAEIDAVVRMIREKNLRDGYIAYLGLAMDMHDDPRYLKEVANKVSKEEVLTYYEAHKDEFKRVDRVRVQHLHVASDTEADRIHKEIEAGLDFSEAVKKYSTNDDKNLEVPGDSGWLIHDDKEKTWFEQLAFIYPKDTISRPVRLPVVDTSGKEPGYEILRIVERIEGYEPGDSETVRYQASQVIAKLKVRDEYKALLKQLYEAADIHIADLKMAPDTSAPAGVIPSATVPASAAAMPGNGSGHGGHGGGHGHGGHGGHGHGGDPGYIPVPVAAPAAPAPAPAPAAGGQ